MCVQPILPATVPVKKIKGAGRQRYVVTLGVKGPLVRIVKVKSYHPIKGLFTPNETCGESEKEQRTIKQDQTINY